jgi:hypothetical protein
MACGQAALSGQRALAQRVHQAGSSHRRFAAARGAQDGQEPGRPVLGLRAAQTAQQPIDHIVAAEEQPGMLDIEEPQPR